MADHGTSVRPAVEAPEVGRRLADAQAATEPIWRPALALVLLLVLLTTLAATIALASQHWTLDRANHAVPDEGFYWTVAQYQIAHHRLKQELRAIAAGEPAHADELGRRAAVLASKASILSEPSEVRNLLSGVPGYADTTRSVAELQQRIGPTLDKEPFTQADAARVLAEFKAVADDDLLSQLANDVRLAEIAAKDDMLRSLTRRIQWAWGGFALCWAALALWLLSAVRLRRRYRAAATDRQRAVDAMEHAILAKRKFLSMVSHEVRSPLQNIVASTELLSLRERSPESGAAIRRIRRAVAALQAQLRDLLTLARGDAGEFVTQVETFDFAELVRDVCTDLEETALAKGLTFWVDTPPGALTVNADPIRSAQLLNNLVDNAVQYTLEGGVEVRLDAFRQSDPSASARDHGRVRLTVKDSGPGLSPLALQRLNEATPIESSRDGKGIGLFVIRDVLKQLGGHIDVQSGEGQGTAFTVSLPATLADVASNESSAAAGALNLLIVDDRPDVLKALGEVTRHLGHSCDSAGSAAEALGLLTRNRYDVLLIDLEMPGQDGRELATEIRRDGGPNSDSMLILISAAENREIGLAWPFDGFLQKPIDCSDLRRLVGEPATRETDLALGVETP